MLFLLIIDEKHRPNKTHKILFLNKVLTNFSICVKTYYVDIY